MKYFHTPWNMPKVDWKKFKVVIKSRGWLFFRWRKIKTDILFSGWRQAFRIEFSKIQLFYQFFNRLIRIRYFAHTISKITFRSDYLKKSENLIENWRSSKRWLTIKNWNILLLRLVSQHYEWCEQCYCKKIFDDLSECLRSHEFFKQEL